MTEPISIILVDDDEAILDSMKTGLSLEGYRCEAAVGGKSALELINNNPFEVMITDFDMPHMNGLELAKRVKEIRPHTKIIVITGYSAKFSREEAVATGVSDVLKKPFGLRELIEKVNSVKT